MKCTKTHPKKSKKHGKAQVGAKNGSELFIQREIKKCEAAEQQKSLGLYSDYACQTLGSTTWNPGRNVKLFRGERCLDLQTGQEAHKTQKIGKNGKKKRTFLEKWLKKERITLISIFGSFWSSEFLMVAVY